MMSVWRIVAYAVCLLSSGALFAAHSLTWGDSNDLLSTPEQIQEDVIGLDCGKKDRMPAVQTLFEKMGALASEISVEEFKRVKNVTVRRKGKSEGLIIVGAHYDRASVGCGAVDNWSGMVAMAHIYRTVRRMSTNKTVIFVAFGKRRREGWVPGRWQIPSKSLNGSNTVLWSILIVWGWEGLR